MYEFSPVQKVFRIKNSADKMRLKKLSLERKIDEIWFSDQKSF